MRPFLQPHLDFLLDLVLQTPILNQQALHLLLVLRDVLLDLNLCVLLDMRLDILGPVRINQRVMRVLETMR